jgi:hypothetical protein
MNLNVFVFFLSRRLVCLLVVVHRSTSSTVRINKRYYDAWEPNVDNAGNDESGRNNVGQAKNMKKGDLCDNKPLWFLKHQARLGKLSPFHDCLSDHGLDTKK